jgi:hypothetical protein
MEPTVFDPPAVELLVNKDGKIERSAEALRVCHHPYSLSLRKKSCCNTTRAIVRTKRQEVASFRYCEQRSSRRSNPLGTGDCFATYARSDI